MKWWLYETQSFTYSIWINLIQHFLFELFELSRDFFGDAPSGDTFDFSGEFLKNFLLSGNVKRRIYGFNNSSWNWNSSIYDNYTIILIIFFVFEDSIKILIDRHKSNSSQWTNARRDRMFMVETSSITFLL